MIRNHSNISITHDRYLYQGSEMDKEIKGDGNSYTTTFRQLDPRLGRWMSLDPVFQAHQSPYNSMDNNPIIYNDPKGLSVKDWIGKKNNDGTTSWKWDENVTSPSQLPEGYTEYAKPGKEITSITGERLKLLDKGKIAKKQSTEEMTIYPNKPLDLTQNSQGFEPNPTVEQTRGMEVIPVLVYQGGYTDQWIRNLHADINFQITNRSLNELGMGAMAMLAAPFAIGALPTTLQSTIMINYVSESISNESLNPFNHNALSYPLAGFSRGFSLTKQMAIGASSGLVDASWNGGFKGVWNQNKATTVLKVINGATAPFLGNWYGTIIRQGVGGNGINKLEKKLNELK